MSPPSEKANTPFLDQEAAYSVVSANVSCLLSSLPSTGLTNRLTAPSGETVLKTIRLLSGLQATAADVETMDSRRDEIFFSIS